MTESLIKLEKVQRLSPLVVRILGLNPGKFTLQGTNTYLVGAGTRRTLIDTGEGVEGYSELVNDVLKEEDTYIDQIICTHYHRDHIGGIPDILSKCRTTEKVKIFKFPLNKNDDYVSSIVGHLSEKAESIILGDRQVIRIPGATFTVIHTPGHTEDHVSLFFEEERSIFTGDCVLGQGTTHFDNLKQYMESLKKLLDQKPTHLYPGHGPVIVEGSKKIEEYIQHRFEREKQIVSFLKENPDKTPMQIVESIYAAYPKELYAAAEQNVILHLEKLIQEGMVTKNPENNKVTLSPKF